MEFDIQQIETALPSYHVIDQIGSGSIGRVYLIADRQTSQKKLQRKYKFYKQQINCFGMSQYQKNNAMNQVRILGSLSHPNIIQMESCLIDSQQQHIFLMMQYAQGGDLAEIINSHKQKRIRISQGFIWKIIMEIAQGILYLHTNNILHRDIKPANIFKSSNSFKLGDMGVSKIIQHSIATTQIGSPYYTAPQMWQSQNGYNQKCDIWSLGVVIYQLCCLRVPFDASNIHQLIRKMRQFKISKIPTGYSYVLEELIDKMLKKDPKQRISAEQILQQCSKSVRFKGQRERSKSKNKQTLLETLAFPEGQQKWVSFVPLPPKTTRKDSKVQNLKKQQKQQDKDNTKEKSIDAHQRQKSKQNDSILININENRSCCFAFEKEHKKNSSSLSKQKQRIKLPSISRKLSVKEQFKPSQAKRDNYLKPSSKQSHRKKLQSAAKKKKNLFVECLQVARKKTQLN